MQRKDWTPAELFTDGRSGKWVDDDGTVHAHGDHPDNPVAERLAHKSSPQAHRRRCLLTDFNLTAEESALVDAWLAGGPTRPPSYRQTLFGPSVPESPLILLLHRIGLYR